MADAGAGCLTLLGIGQGTSYWIIFVPLVAMGGGLGLLVPPMTSALLGSVEKARSGVAAGVLNSTRQTGSVLGVALFGSLLAGQVDAFLFGTRVALMISAALLICAAGVAIVGRGAKAQNNRATRPWRCAGERLRILLISDEMSAIGT